MLVRRTALGPPQRSVAAALRNRVREAEQFSQTGMRLVELKKAKLCCTFACKAVLVAKFGFMNAKAFKEL